VAAAADRHQQLAAAGEAYRRDDIGQSGAARNQRRASVDHAVPHFPGFIVARAAGTDQLAAQACPKSVHRGPVKGRFFACDRGNSEIGHGLSSQLIMM
jgi:hypothetical protein